MERSSAGATGSCASLPPGLGLPGPPPGHSCAGAKALPKPAAMLPAQGGAAPASCRKRLRERVAAQVPGEDHEARPAHACAPDASDAPDFKAKRLRLQTPADSRPDPLLQALDPAALTGLEPPALVAALERRKARFDTLWTPASGAQRAQALERARDLPSLAGRPRHHWKSDLALRWLVLRQGWVAATPPVRLAGLAQALQSLPGPDLEAGFCLRFQELMSLVDLLPHEQRGRALALARDPQPLAALQGRALSLGLLLRLAFLGRLVPAMEEAQHAAAMVSACSFTDLVGLEPAALSRALALRLQEWRALLPTCTPGARAAALDHVLGLNGVPSEPGEAQDRALDLRGVRMQALYEAMAPDRRIAALEEALDPCVLLAAPAAPRSIALALRRVQVRVLAQALDASARDAALQRARDPARLALLAPAEVTLADLQGQALDDALQLRHDTFSALVARFTAQERDAELDRARAVDALTGLDRTALARALALRQQQFRALYAPLQADERLPLQRSIQRSLRELPTVGHCDSEQVLMRLLLDQELRALRSLLPAPPAFDPTAVRPAGAASSPAGATQPAAVEAAR